jgi:hypothetical protein
MGYRYSSQSRSFRVTSRVVVLEDGGAVAVALEVSMFKVARTTIV